MLALGAFVACATQTEEDPGGSSSNGGASGAAGKGGTAGTAGSAGSAGSSMGFGGSATGGSAGSAGKGGSAGSSGAGGSGGSAGSAGTAGTAGTAGSGGTGSATFPGTAGECAASSTFRVEYKPEQNSKTIQVTLHVINESGSAVPLNQIEVYYFFSQEETSGWVPKYYEEATTDTGGSMYVSFTGGTVGAVGQLTPALTNASHFWKTSFTASASLANDFWIQLNIAIEPVNFDVPDQVQTDDYSFEQRSALADWDKIVVYHNGTLVWGCVPDSL